MINLFIKNGVHLNIEDTSYLIPTCGSPGPFRFTVEISTDQGSSLGTMTVKVATPQGIETTSFLPIQD